MLQFSPSLRNFVLKVVLTRTIKHLEINSFHLFYHFICSLLCLIIPNYPFLLLSDRLLPRLDLQCYRYSIHNYRVPFLFYHETTGLVLVSKALSQNYTQIHIILLLLMYRVSARLIPQSSVHPVHMNANSRSCTYSHIHMILCCILSTCPQGTYPCSDTTNCNTLTRMPPCSTRAQMSLSCHTRKYRYQPLAVMVYIFFFLSCDMRKLFTIINMTYILSSGLLTLHSG